MDHAGVHIAQFNTATLRHPIGHPATASFEALIDETNRHAEASPGFVWRHGIDTREDDLPYGDPLITVNASVWESAQQLRDFAYRGFHRDVYRQRADWFVDSAAVMWWIDPGTVPTMDECLARMDFHGRFGSTPYAFTTGERVPVVVLRADIDSPSAASPVGAGAWVHPEPAGRVLGSPIDDHTWELEHLSVDPPHRRLHIGAALLSTTLVSARTAGVTTIRAACPTGADEVVALLRAMDFGDADHWDGAPAGSRCMTLAVEPITSWRRPPGAKPPRD